MTLENWQKCIHQNFQLVFELSVQLIQTLISDWNKNHFIIEVTQRLGICVTPGAQTLVFHSLSAQLKLPCRSHVAFYKKCAQGSTLKNFTSYYPRTGPPEGSNLEFHDCREWNGTLMSLQISSSVSLESQNRVDANYLRDRAAVLAVIREEVKLCWDCYSCPSCPCIVTMSPSIQKHLCFHY